MYKFMVVMKYPIWDFMVFLLLNIYVVSYFFFNIIDIMQGMSLDMKVAPFNPPVLTHFR